MTRPVYGCFTQREIMALEIDYTEDGRIQFQGLFEDLQMGPLLLWILEEEQQGELTITTEGLQQTIYFSQGYPIGTRGGPPENFLGWILREKGQIDDGTYLTSLQRMAEEQQLQGQILLQMGAVNEQQLLEALQLQLQRKLIRLFRPTEGEFYFLSSPELIVYDVEIGSLNPYTVTANAVRQEFLGDRLNHCLAALEGYAIKLDPDSGWRSHIKELRLEDDEVAALSLLERWNTLEHFVSQRYLDPVPCQMLVALLFSTNLLELDDAEEHTNLQHSIEPTATNMAGRSAAPPQQNYEPEPEGVSIRVETAKRPGPAPQKDPNAPRKRASVTVHLKEDRIETKSSIPVEPQASWEAPQEFIPPQDDEQTDPSLAAVPANTAAAVISAAPATQAPPAASAPTGDEMSDDDKAHQKAVEDKLKAIEKANYYQILGIEKGADGDAIRKAYYAQSRTYHPDRVAGTPLEHLKGDLDEIFSKLNEAYSTLSNAETKAEYDERLENPEAFELEERAPKAAQAEVFFSKANVYIKKKDFAAAEEELQWACKLLEDEGDYQVALAWAIYNNPQRGAEEKFQKAIFHLENANSCGNADKVKMRWYWAQIYKQEGDLKNALEQIKLLLKVNPRHVEATRELRNLKATLRNTGEGEAVKGDKKGAKKGLFGFLKK